MAAATNNPNRRFAVMMPFDFLICSERSGSNLITKILDAHPRICGPFPSHMIRTLALNINNYGDLGVDRNWRALLEDTAGLLEHGIAKWSTSFSPQQLERELRTRTLGALIRFVYESEASAHGKNRVFVKENHTYTFLSYLVAHFPDSRYVFLVRDPRDMALTWKEAPSAHGAVKSAARQWKEDQGRSLEAYGFLNDLGNIILIRFEDLVGDTENTVRRTCAFLGVEYAPAMLEFHTKGIVGENAARMSSWGDLRQPIIPNNFNLYEARLNEAEIRFVETLCREEMSFFGYEPRFDASVPLEELERSLPEELTTRDEGELTETERTLFAAFDAARQRIIDRR
jgi:hypothetical protein